jgi:hypothetical protein
MPNRKAERTVMIGQNISIKSAESAETVDSPASPRTTRKRGTAGRAGKAGTRKGKYNAAGERIDGIFFHSKAEGVRYLQLKAMQEQGKIENLTLQPPYECVVKNQKITTYRADFKYLVVDDRGYAIKVVVEDVKGMLTDIYKLKKKLVEACYDIKILEIPAKDVEKWDGRLG